MNPSDVVAVAAIALTAVVPLAVVVLVALLRGYTIQVNMRRPPRYRERSRGGRRMGDED